MDMIKDMNKLLNSVSFFVRSGYALGLPSELHIEPTNHCNLSCPLCPKGNGKMTRKTGAMPFRGFKKIIDDLPRLKSVLIWNYGEPLLNKDIFKMIKYARDKKISVKTSTNGQLISKEVVGQILDSGLDKINIALDGVSQGTYGAYRVGGDVNKVIDGVKALVAERESRGTSHPIVTLEFLVMRHNEHEIPAFGRLCKELGVDIMSIKTVNLYGNTELSEKFLPKNRAYSRYTDKIGIRWRQRRSSGCFRLFNSIMVNWDGSVAACCYDYNEEICMGNALEENVRDIWNGKQFRDLRHRLFGSSVPNVCKECPAGYPNIWVMKKSLRGGVKPVF